MRYIIVLVLSFSQFAHAFTPDEDGLYAVFDTSLGEFTVELRYTAAPLTTANFVGLAEGTIPRRDPDTGEVISNGPYYDGLIFHQVAEQTFIQSGDPEPDNAEINGPGYTIPDEMHPNLTHFQTYVISMFNERCVTCIGPSLPGENTNGSQFFITLQPPENTPTPGDLLDGFRSVFGSAVDGIDVIEAIGAVEVDETNLRPVEDVVINTVTIVREGVDAEAFQVTNFELPIQLEPEIGFSAEKEKFGFEFAALPGAPYLVNFSSDLENWTEKEIYTSDAETTIQHYVAPATSGATFVDISADVEPIDYSERIPGAQFTANMGFIAIGQNFGTWIFTFDEDGTGTLEIPGFDFGGQDMVVLSYEYHRLPNGARIKTLSNNFHEMVFYLKFVDETTGGIFVWVEDYLNRNSQNDPPLRYPTTGTFELILPEED